MPYNPRRVTVVTQLGCSHCTAKWDKHLKTLVYKWTMTGDKQARDCADELEIAIKELKQADDEHFGHSH